jgi:predicted enzyme related to lactoylglutathione lyase
MTQNSHQETQPSECGVDASLARHGALSYLEIPAIDARQSAVFYEKVLGWRVHGDDLDHPKFSDQTGNLIGRWVIGRAIHRKPGLLPYIYVDDIADVVTRVTAQGSEIIKAPFPEGNLLISIIRDPAGNVIGLWQKAPSG